MAPNDPATAATWLNYATTLAFQILFAAHFGTSTNASQFVVVFVVVTSLASIQIATGISIAVPRLLTDDGLLARPAIRYLLVLGFVAVATAGAVGLAAPALAEGIASILGVGSTDLAWLLLIGTVFFASTVGVGLGGAVLLATGHRFLPALASALPTAAGAAYLVGAGTPSVQSTLVAVAAGAAIQLLIVATALRRVRRATADGPPIRVGRLAAMTGLQFAMLGLLPILQRLVAGAGDPAGAVRFDYAIRGTTVAQQLLIGGLVVAALPDWSARRRAGRTIGRDAATTGLIACLLLVAAASVAFVAAPVLTAAAFQRGAFHSADTDAVATAVRWLLVGFVAEGIGLVLVQAIVAAGRNDLALVIGFGRLAIQVIATVVLGISFGAVGVSAAYSVAFALAGVAIVVLARRHGLFEPPGSLRCASWPDRF